MRGCDRRVEPKAVFWRAVMLAAACLAGACTTSGGRQAGKIEFQQDGGFTITEGVRFSSNVRRDFKKALRLLEEEEVELGIELLEQVAAAAPQATAAHIDLGIAYRQTGDYERAEASIPRLPSLPASTFCDTRRFGTREWSW